ncbi:MAG: rRNA maturation RNase YbeY [Patescibacteria group bacterium]
MIGINNRTKSKINLALVKKTTAIFLEFYNKNNSEISIAFIGDKAMRKLNKTYRDLDRVTDVLAFPAVVDRMSQEKLNPDLEVGMSFLGEIIIDYAQIKRQAKKFSNSVNKEMVFILVHGLLHLLGYEDETKKGKKMMEDLAVRFINKL